MQVAIITAGAIKQVVVTDKLYDGQCNCLGACSILNHSHSVTNKRRMQNFCLRVILSGLFPDIIMAPCDSAQCLNERLMQGALQWHTLKRLRSCPHKQPETQPVGCKAHGCSHAPALPALKLTIELHQICPDGSTIQVYHAAL